ncbi:hypothetical protein HHI36_019672 [Cryptolaemus montrouzieri]|uniref:Uncharacterized protein n=1 Tax=Cryptolaemus montrouzieri TaxID=559131 RepID=A0ABD2N7X2_9CUCU
MDSGLGSDEDRKGRTKEQKQLRNQQLLSGCFIDAASLSDDADADQRRNDERRQGALIFQSSIPQFSMLQMSDSDLSNNICNDDNATGNFEETSTPFNSIVHLDSDDSARKSPLGFYVDLSEVPEIPKSAPVSGLRKNIFSLVIDFEAPKKEKPVSLSSSYIHHRRKKLSKQNGKHNDSLSGSGSSINSVPGTSREVEVAKVETNNDLYVKKCNSSLCSSNEDIAVDNDKNSEVVEKYKEEPKEDVVPHDIEISQYSVSNSSVPEEEIEEGKSEVKEQ